MVDRGFSCASLTLTNSVTHGTTAKVEEMNGRAGANAQVIDLSIGTLDLPVDPQIDEGVCTFIRDNAQAIHAFAPVKGFPFLRRSIAAKIRRMHGIELDPETGSDRHTRRYQGCSHRHVSDLHRSGRRSRDPGAELAALRRHAAATSGRSTAGPRPDAASGPHRRRP